MSSRMVRAGRRPPAYDGTEILSVDKSYTGDVVASGDCFGRVRMARFPAAVQGASYNEYRGHCSPVSKVRFSFDDKYLMTSGKYDRCIFQWRHENEQADEGKRNFEMSPIARTRPISRTDRCSIDQRSMRTQITSL